MLKLKNEDMPGSKQQSNCEDNSKAPWTKILLEEMAPEDTYMNVKIVLTVASAVLNPAMSSFFSLYANLTVVHWSVRCH